MCFERQIRGAHNALAQVVNAVEEVGVIIIWDFLSVVGHDAGEDSCHHILGGLSALETGA